MVNVALQSEVTLAPFFDFSGFGQVANLNEGPSPVFTPGNNALNSRLIQTDQDISIRFQWSVRGVFAHVFNPNAIWRLELLLEQMGPSEFTLPRGVTTLTYGSGTMVGGGVGAVVNFPGAGAPNSTTITIPGGTIPEGIYDVVAVLRLLHPDGTPCFLAAFAEFGKLDFYAEH
mgnify:CR=1 FL=1